MIGPKTLYVNVLRQKWHILTFFRKNGIVLHIYSLERLQWSLENVPVEPETATLEPLEVPVEPRSAAVEHVAAPVEPVLAPVDKGSSP